MNKIFIKSETKNIAQVENLIDDLIEKNSIDSDIYGKVLLAVIEGVNNAIIHGNRSDKNKDVEIQYHVSDDHIVFIIIDQGEGFNYESLPDPTLPENVERTSGRGIFLMRHLADETKFNDKGNEVTLTFNLI